MTEQALAKQMLETHGAENVIVIVGFTNVWTLRDERVGEVLVRTFWDGDPGGAGPLKKSNPPRIKTYSIFEFENEIPEEIWKKHRMHRKKREVGQEALEAFIDRLKELRND